MRVGMGYDVHRLAEDRKMILGGVEIPYEKGLLSGNIFRIPIRNIKGFPAFGF